MRLESLKELKKSLPNRFRDLIEHYDLLVHGMSGRYRLLGGRDTENQMRYQANLLKSISESHDSADSGDEGQNKGDSKGKGKAGENAEDEMGSGGEMAPGDR